MFEIIVILDSCIYGYILFVGGWITLGWLDNYGATFSQMHRVDGGIVACDLFFIGRGVSHVWQYVTEGEEHAKGGQIWSNSVINYITSAKEVMFLSDCLFVCLCEQDNSKSYGRILLKFWGYVGHDINYQWFNFGHDPAGILDSGSLWNFRYHCVKGGIREPLAKRRWWRHLANSCALAEVPAGYDCVYFLLLRILLHIFF